MHTEFPMSVSPPLNAGLYIQAPCAAQGGTVLVLLTLALALALAAESLISILPEGIHTRRAIEVSNAA